VSNNKRLQQSLADWLKTMESQARSTEPRDLIGAPTISDAAQALLSGRLPGRTDPPVNGAEVKTPAMKAEEKLDQLKFAKIDSEPVILGFQAENKTFVRPVSNRINDRRR
jgi:hypothetical protein